MGSLVLLRGLGAGLNLSLQQAKAELTKAKKYAAGPGYDPNCLSSEQHNEKGSQCTPKGPGYDTKLSSQAHLTSGLGPHLSPWITLAA